MASDEITVLIQQGLDLWKKLPKSVRRDYEEKLQAELDICNDLEGKLTTDEKKVACGKLLHFMHQTMRDIAESGALEEKKEPQETLEGLLEKALSLFRKLPRAFRKRYEDEISLALDQYYNFDLTKDERLIIGIKLLKRMQVILEEAASISEEKKTHAAAEIKTGPDLSLLPKFLAAMGLAADGPSTELFLHLKTNRPAVLGRILRCADAAAKDQCDLVGADCLWNADVGRCDVQNTFYPEILGATDEERLDRRASLEHSWLPPPYAP